MHFHCLSWEVSFQASQGKIPLLYRRCRIEYEKQRRRLLYISVDLLHTSSCSWQASDSTATHPESTIDLSIELVGLSSLPEVRCFYLWHPYALCLTQHSAFLAIVHSSLKPQNDSEVFEVLSEITFFKKLWKGKGTQWLEESPELLLGLTNPKQIQIEDVLT